MIFICRIRPVRSSRNKCQFTGINYGTGSFVVWRESFEALLVVGIIYAWIKQHPDAAAGRRYLWGGVALGVALSLFLALLIYGVFNVLDDSGQTYFMIGMSLFAAVLIVQMVYWMQQHSASLKSGIEQEMNDSARQHSWWGALFIVAIAIAREGSEIVVFLSGIVMGLNADTMWSFTGSRGRYRGSGTDVVAVPVHLPENCPEMVFPHHRYCAVVPCLFAAA